MCPTTRDYFLKRCWGGGGGQSAPLPPFNTLVHGQAVELKQRK